MSDSAARTDRGAYVPIDCGFHDRLESAAVRGAPCDLAVRAPDGSVSTRRVRVADVFAEGGAEFALLGDGARVRLDHVEALDGVPRPDGASCALP